MNSSPFKCSLFWVSLVVVAAAAWLWNGKMERRHELLMARNQQRAERDAQRAAAFLTRAFYADNFLTYSALSKSTARMGNSQIASTARITHAPRRLSIIYLEGDYAGLHSGYNEQWAWRQTGSAQPMIPYAAMERPTTDMASRRFALLLENYQARWQGTDELNGRKVVVIHLKPYRPAKGAQGPAKKLWIDNQTGLTLRQQTFNYQMTPVMESVLSNINLAPAISEATFVPPSTLQAAAKHRPWMAHDISTDQTRIAKLAGVYPPQPEKKSLPDGFAFDSVGSHRCETCNSTSAGGCHAALSRYTDGLNTLTVFASKPQCGQMKQIAQSRNNQEPSSFDYGSGNLMMRSTSNGHLIAVADLPAPVLKNVLEATTVRTYEPSRN